MGIVSAIEHLASVGIKDVDAAWGTIETPLAQDALAAWTFVRTPLQNALGQFAASAYAEVKQVISDAVQKAIAALGAGASFGDIIAAAIKTVEAEAPAAAKSLGPMALHLLTTTAAGIAAGALA
ncbi:MAG TPA: hypothetical protein VMT58_00435 [Candidatus Binataceae bacterium]|nr:hypothetical protein [Candidatus Binataceae bacterium]